MMRRLAAAVAAAFLLTAGVASAQSPDPAPALGTGHQECMPVAPHSGRQAPAAAYNLHVFDARDSAPLFRAFENSEGWYYIRVYPGEVAKVLWHGSAWISNFSSVPVAACFFVP